MSDSHLALPDFDSPLLDSQAWADLKVLETIEQQFKTFMGSLPLDAQKRYLKVSQEELILRQKADNALNGWLADFQASAKATLRNALKHKTGQDLDVDTTYLHTRYRTDPNTVHSIKDSPDRTQTVSLWQAALTNFAFNVAHGTGSGQAIARASSINTDRSGRLPDSLMTLEQFAQVARSADLGSYMRSTLENALSGALGQCIREQQRSNLELEILESLRSSTEHASQTHEQLLQAVTTGQWARYTLTYDFYSAPLPLYLWQTGGSAPAAVFSYFPNRPGGALRRHGTVHAALDSWIEQVKHDSTHAAPAWLLSALADGDRESIARHFNVEDSGLNWVANNLRDATLGIYRVLSHTDADGKGLMLKKADNVDGSLQDALFAHKIALVRARLIEPTKTVAEQDWDQVKGALSYALEEILAMLTLPVPGGVTGLNRVMLAATLGLQGYQMYQAAKALIDRDDTALAQALVDLTDLIVTARLQKVAGKLSAKRARTLVKDLGEPRRRGATFQQDPAQAHELTYDPSEKASRPDNLDTGAVRSRTWFERMLHPGFPAFSAAAIKQALQLSGVNGNHLKDTWHGRKHTPWALKDALRAAHCRQQIDKVLGAGVDDALPASELAERMLLPALAQQTGHAIEVQSPGGTQRLWYDQPGAATSTSTIVLTRTPAGLYQTREGGAGYSLIEATLRAYETRVPGSELGKIGDITLDRHSAHRVSELKRQLLSRLRRDQNLVFQALVVDSLQMYLPTRHPAHAYSAAGRTSSEQDHAPSLDSLRSLFPELSQAALKHALGNDNTAQQTQAWARGTPLPTRVAGRLRVASEQSRLNAALSSLADPNGRGINDDSEALFGTLLTLHAKWPANTALRVYASSLDSTGKYTRDDYVLDSYGPDDASAFIDIVKVGHRYAATTGRSQDLLSSSHPNSLLDACLLSLSAEQRKQLGFSEHDHGRLAHYISERAEYFNEELFDMLTPPRDTPLAAETLHGFAAGVDLSLTSADARGIHWQGGKHYLLIDGSSYQIVEDKGQPNLVWRIVKPADPAGISIAVVSRPQRLWMQTRTGGMGGSGRGRMSAYEKYLPKATKIEQFTQIHQGYLDAAAEFSRNLTRINLLVNNPNEIVSDLARKKLETLVYEKITRDTQYIADVQRTWRARVISDNSYTEKTAITLKSISECYRNLIELHKTTLQRKTNGQSLPSWVSDLPGFKERAPHYLENVLNTYPILVKAHEVVNQRLEKFGHDPDLLADIELTQAELKYKPVELLLSEMNLRCVLLQISSENTRGEDSPVLDIEGLSQGISLALKFEHQLETMPTDFKGIFLEYHLESVESLQAKAADMRHDFSESENIQHLDKLDLTLERLRGQARRGFNDEINPETYRREGADAIDYDFLPAIHAPAAPSPARRRVIRTRDRQAYIAEPLPSAAGEPERVQVRLPASSTSAEQLLPFTRNSQGDWVREQIVLPAPTLGLDALHRKARAQMRKATAEQAVGERRVGSKTRPGEIEDDLVKMAEALEATAADLRALAAASTTATPDEHIGQLDAGSKSLRDTGRRLRIAQCKRLLPDLSNLEYLFDQGEVSIEREPGLLKLAKDDVIVEYCIKEKASGDELWWAHFHYASAQAPFADSTAAHLKTVKERKEGRTAEAIRKLRGDNTKIVRTKIVAKAALKMFQPAR
ncbi:MAG: hypothetical protein PW845_28280 [Pseudomonas sp.]|nr:hypothetical protein [Pseudomonas sp.]